MAFLGSLSGERLLCRLSISLRRPRKPGICPVSPRARSNTNERQGCSPDTNFRAGSAAVEFVIVRIRPERQPEGVVNEKQADNKRLMVLSLPDEELPFFGRILDRNGIDALRIATGRECLDAAARERYDLILIRIPIGDLSVSALATGLAQRFSLNAETPLMLLADGKQYEAALGYANARVQVIDLEDSDTHLDRLVSTALGLASRAAARLQVEVEIENAESQDRRRCQTRNISTSGMLIETRTPLPVGTEFAFNFTLPERFTPIHGRARVVRQAAELEPTASGLGVQFLSFPEGAEQAIQAFVEQHRDHAR